ncbi:hypothetical protein [Actinoplanes sp. N902-109]|uniref:hypothetical protein n=1 Tax=Actinoplanes sp. (strain N902-109) TaxID=649831 RepID=UPI0003295AD2|nr:hypothetical protein [Actinoplanes sp. N902-109]AGL19050.1 hypothetical protein L083_5540 [Actinoplanes sp. N902-109]
MRTFLVACLVLGSLAACGRATGPTTVDPATVDMITHSGPFLDRYHQVDVAFVAATRQCMRAAGHDWQGAPDAVNPEAKEGGGVSLDQIRTRGYGLSDDRPPQDPGTATEALAVALLGERTDLAELVSPRGGVYLYPRHGCAARTYTALYGDLETWARVTNLPQEINIRLGRQAEADPRYAAKLRQWRECMTAKGYSYASPDAIVQSLRRAYEQDRRPLPERRAAEIRIALDDVSCNKGVRLTATALQLRRSYAQRISPAERTEMNRLAGQFAVALKRSETPVGTSG